MKETGNKMHFMIIILIALIANGLSTVRADAAELKATAHPNPVTQGERIQVIYSLEASGSNFQGPNFRGFTILMGPSQSQSIQIINGSMSRSLKFTYILQADKPGEYTIGPASIVVDGNRISSNSLKITVLEPTQAQKQQRQHAKEQKEEEERSLSEQANRIMNENLYMTVTLNKSDIYEGQQVVATYKLYAHPELAIVQMSPKKNPVFDGFWIQEFDLGNLSFSRENVNGRIMNTAVLKKVVLIPQRNGNLSIDPLILDFTVRLKVRTQNRRNDPFANFFDDPFFGGSYRDFPFELKSPVKSLNVRPLPEGAPESFTGAVGSMLMETWLESDKARTGEPVTMKIKISGNGNIKLLDAPEVNFPPDFEVYDPKISDNLTLGHNGISGNKIFEILAIPRHTGKYSIDPVKFTYFDVDKEEYITLRSDRFDLNVEKGKDGEYVSSIGKEEIKLLGKDINYIKLKPGDIRPVGISFMKTWAIILSILPALLFAFVILYKKRNKKYEDNYDLLRNRKATKLARKRLSRAKSLIGKNDEEFFDETTRALWGYLSDKLLIPGSDLTKDKVANLLGNKNIEDDTIQKLIGTIEECEFARYAPSSVSGNTSEIYESSVELIAKLEEKLK